MNPYGELGVKRVVNCMGAVTFLGGLPLADGVTEAMVAASRAKVDLNELNTVAGKRIAELAEAEAAFVTTGAAAGWGLAAAACLAGTDPARVARLPAIDWEACEIVIHRKHRCNFDHALRATGATLVEFGYSRDRTESWELEAAITTRTAAVAYVASFGNESVLPLEEVVAIAHHHGVPVVVDAAVSLPPAFNLQALPATGADLCSFSGGKAVGGPQNTGFIVGRADLIDACAQNANPNHNTIGRPLKVNAEAIVGLVAALENYVERDHDADAARWREQLERIGRHVDSVRPGLCSIVPTSNHGMPIPALHLRLPGGAAAVALAADRLQAGDPPVYVNTDGDALVVNPHALAADDVDLVAERLAHVVV